MPLHFEGFTLDTDGRELRRGEARIAVEPQVFDLLAYLVKNRERVIDQDELLQTVWGGRVVSPSTLTSRVNAARAALGDSGAEQKLIKTIPRKGYRFIGKLDRPPAERQRLRQDIHFCTTCNGARIAYSTVGHGTPVVKAGNWLNHLEYDWESPIWSPLLHWLAERHLLVRYDARGNGLSDWNVADISFDAFVRDLEAVADGAGLDRFSLFGVS
jgi:DNA-binding winged helix-turn-helix (wHTH) protein